MSEIQKDVKQFKYTHSRFYDTPQKRLEVCDEIDALLRKVVEECCGAVKYTVGDQESHAIIDNINLLFAWLLEGD